MSIRNACHVLMIAIERNDQDLVEQSLGDLPRTRTALEIDPRFGGDLVDASNGCSASAIT